MSTDPMPGGRRRIDRVLAEDYLSAIESLDLEDVRNRRHEAEQEEADLSYVRRVLQGRADLLRFELDRRSNEPGAEPSHDDDSLVRRLTSALTDPTQRGSHGLGRHLSVEPSRVDEHRRAVEQLAADVGVSDLAGQTDEQLRAALSRVEDVEHQVSGNRRRVQQVMDALTEEITRRYREGAARVDDLLTET